MKRLHLAGSLLFIAAAFYIGFQSKFLAEKENNTWFAPPTELLVHSTLGYRDTFADLMWLRVIQDFWVCDKPRTDKPATSPSETSRCQTGWVFHMLDGITELAPRFRLAHATGAVMLSISVDDREGARRIFDKAIERYPLDYPIIYAAAYHYMNEIGDKAKAANLILSIRDNPKAPPWFTALAAHLLSDAGQDEIAIQVLTDFIKANENDSKNSGVERARFRLQEILKKRSKN